MDILLLITIFFYLISTAGYVAYLFFQQGAWEKAGCWLLFAGFLCHTAYILAGIFSTGLFPGRNLYQTLVLAGWALSGAFLFVRLRFHLRVLGVYGAPLAAVVMVMASRLPAQTLADTRFFKSYWVFFHVIVMFLGNAAFALACGVGILYLLQERAIKAKRQGFFFKRLPSLELLDSVSHRCIVSGFVLLTIGLAAGFVYAKIAWGRFWSWDPKEVWAGVVWLFYAALLHERLTVGWRGRRAAVMAIIGFAVVLFTFLGVNLFMEGHHGEFTRW
jgi:cytochrome c-type biogenesis protein CcsB